MDELHVGHKPQPDNSKGSRDSCQSIEALLDAARKQPEALDALFGRYRTYFRVRLRGDARLKRFRAKLDSSDVLQTAMVDAFVSFPKFRGTTEREFSAWLSRIVVTTIIDAKRKFFAEARDIGREVPLGELMDGASLEFQVAANQSGPVSRVIRGDSAIMLAEAIEALPPAQAEAITLRHLQQMPIMEIAGTMDKSVSAVGGYLRRGMKALRQSLPNLLQ